MTPPWDRVLIVIGALAIVAIGLMVARPDVAYDSIEVIYPDPVNRAGFQLRTLARRIMRFDSINQELPASLEDLTKDGTELNPFARDPWGTMFNYAVEDNTFVLRSAGADKVVDTGDDLAIGCRTFRNQDLDTAMENGCDLHVPAPTQD